MATPGRPERRPVPDHRLEGIRASGPRPTPEQLGQWTLTDLQPGTLSVTKENFAVLSSYNWREAKRPIIVVPGAPPTWDPPELPISLKPDCGHNFSDQNAFRHPTSPLEPIIQAVLTSDPSFDLNKIDIITDRTNLRRLLQFASGQSHKDFEIAVEVVNKTVLFTRLENRPRVYIKPGQPGGYGFRFEKAFTKPPGAVKGSTGHYRIVNYTIGGLNMLLRFEVDGALPHDVNPSSYAGSQKPTPTVVLPIPNTPQPTALATDLWSKGQQFQGQQFQGQQFQGQQFQGQQFQGQQFQGQQFQGQRFQGQLFQGPGQLFQGQLFQGQSFQGQPFQRQPFQRHPLWGYGQGLGGASVGVWGQQAAGGTNLGIVNGGVLIHDQQTIELKTRAYKKDRGLQLQQYMAQLWFAGTRYLVLGIHKEGTFSDVKTHTVNDAAVIAWEEAHKEQLGKLVNLLGKIIATAKGTAERTRVRCVKGNLTVGTFHGRHSKLQKLSQDLRLKWTGEGL